VSVELWSSDEHRLGLKPVLRRIWAPRGQRPVTPVEHRYQWLYLYGFVQPATGRAYLPLLPKANADCFNQALQGFAQVAGVGASKQVILVVDRAGWHRAKKLALPEGVHLIFLPPYSPELQPLEPLWPLTNEAIANRHFADLEALQSAQEERCATLQASPELVRRRTHFHWWPQIDTITN
jgi:transposase